jgi:hypothetical protein
MCGAKRDVRFVPIGDIALSKRDADATLAADDGA